MSRIRNILVALFFIFLVNVGFSQSENSLYLLENVYQSSYSNPLNVPQNNVHIGLPLMSSVSGYGLVEHHTLKTSTREEGGNLVFDEDLVGYNSGLKKKNHINFGFNYDLLSVRIKTNNKYWSLNITDKFTYSFRYPKQLLELAAQGNEQFAGQTVDLSQLAVNSTFYKEIGLGLLVTGENLNWFVKPKVLFGLANVKTSINSLDYSIEKNTNLSNEDTVIYRQSFYADGTIHTSGGDTTGEAYEEGSDVVAQYLNTKNLGLALDFGASYKVNERLEVSASVLDLGFIRWKDKVINYSFNDDTSYAGVDLYNEFEGSENGIDADLDSIGDSFNYSSDGASYNTMLNYRINLSGKYEFIRNTYVSLLVHFNNYAGFKPSVTAGIYREFGRTFNLAITNSYQHNRFLNLGLAFALNIKPIQLYVATDKLDLLFNMVSVEGTTVPYNANYFNFRFGINLIFGNIRYQEQIPIDND